MLIKRKCSLDGSINEMDIPVTPADLHTWQITGDLIQNTFPQLKDYEREFLMTGITPEIWDRIFGEGD